MYVVRAFFYRPFRFLALLVGFICIGFGVMSLVLATALLTDGSSIGVYPAYFYLGLLLIPLGFMLIRWSER